jgi:thiol-disulfide isomerase/thioredoxin
MASSNMIKPFATLPLVGVVLLIAAGLYWLTGSAGKVESPQVATSEGSLRARATGTMAAFLVHDRRKDIAPFSFRDAAGADRTLADFKGRTVLLNLWATWCAPCRKEMPDLAQLQKDLGGEDFEVLALSLDIKGADASAAFLKQTGAGNLALYTDANSASLAALQALGLPVTILIDRDGKEAGRLLGPANWASDEAKALIKAALENP